MRIYPPHAGEKLGFGIVRARIEAHLRTEEGRENLAGEHPASEIDAVTARVAAVRDVQSMLRFDDPPPWDELPDIRAFARAIRPADSVPDPRDLLDLLSVVRAAERLKAYLAARAEKYPSLASITARIADLSTLRKTLETSIGSDGEILDSASEGLARVRRNIASREHELRQSLQKELRQAISSGFATEDQPTIRNGRMVIPVRAEAKRKVKGFVQDTSATGQTVFIEPEACLQLNNDLRELQAEERQEERRVLAAIGDRVRQVLDGVLATSAALAEFDVLQAKARVANALQATVPALNEGSRIVIRDGRNPALLLHFGVEGGGADAGADVGREAGAEDAAEGPGDTRQVVPLDLEMDADRKTLLITGPNAGGKTVALGTIGLFSMMIAHGIPVPAADGTDLPVFSGILVDIGDEQSIEDDLSTFSSHMRNIREMVCAAGPRTLVLIDEAGTGTDPEEGAALAQAALEALHDSGTWTIATTHHGRLKAFAHQAGFARNAAMEFDLDSLEPTYRLRMDLAGSSYAFEIGRRMDLPPSLLERARELIGTPKTSLEELITEYESRLARLESAEAEAGKILRDASEMKQEYDALRADFERTRSRNRVAALEEAQQVLRKANALVERTVREIRESQADKGVTRAARAELVEHRRRIEDALERARAAAAAPGPEDTDDEIHAPIDVGDQVVLDDGSVTAEVVELDADTAVITSGALRMRVDLSRLRKVGGRRRQQVHVRQTMGEGDTPSALGVRQRIDVRGRRVDEAIAEVARFVDAALPTSLKRLEILHGKGTGALREAVHEYLDGRPEVASYEEAEWEHGGAGVTIVHLP